MKKLLSVLMCLAIFLPALQAVSAADVPDFSSEEAAMSYFRELSMAQAGAVAAHDALTKAFWPDTYPENYGGAYIEDNLLHINLVDLEHQDLSPYESALAGHLDAVRFMDVDYSLHTLAQAMEPIQQELQALGVHVVRYSVSSTDNAVSIGITEDSVSRLPAELVLDVPSFYTVFQVPVLITVMGIPTVLTAADSQSSVPGTLPAFLPMLGCALLLLSAAGILLLKKRH